LAAGKHRLKHLLTKEQLLIKDNEINLYRFRNLVFHSHSASLITHRSGIFSVCCVTCKVLCFNCIKMPLTRSLEKTKRDVSPQVFQALLNLDVHKLSQCSDDEIRVVIPCLARISLIGSLDQSAECIQSRRSIFGILTGREVVNSIVGLLSVDFHALEVDVRKEQMLRYFSCFCLPDFYHLI